MTLKKCKCFHCGNMTLADIKDSRPMCEECLDAYVARGCRSDPFWFVNDMVLQRQVDAEIGDL